MLFELTQGDKACYNTLIEIARKTLYPSVRKWCNGNSALKGYEEDLMQEIYIRLITKSVTGFLMRDGQLNDDPEGFKNWLFAVAKNLFNDLAKKSGRKGLYETETPEGEEPTEHGPYSEPEEPDYDMLNRCFKTVLSFDSKVHIPLTWVTAMLMIANGGMNRIEATDAITRICSEMTLDAMFDFILIQSDKILWLRLDEDEIQKIKGKLDETDSDGMRIGDKNYNNFYMKKGAKASVSDWINRMNSRIIREEVEEDETPDN